VTIRTLDHSPDSPYNLLALWMVRQGVAELTLTPEDVDALEQVMADGSMTFCAMYTPEGNVSVRFMNSEDVPPEDAQIQ